MIEPIFAVPALPFIALALTAVGTGVAAYGQVKAGKAADQAAKATQEADNANALAAQQQAAYEAQQVRRKNLLRFGEQRAAAAKSGVLINDSAADVIYDTSIQGELEAQAALYSGAASSNYYRSRGAIARLEGSNAKSASRIQAGSTIIGGLGKAASLYPQGGGNGGSGRSALYNQYGPQ